MNLSSKPGVFILTRRMRFQRGAHRRDGVDAWTWDSMLSWQTSSTSAWCCGTACGAAHAYAPQRNTALPRITPLAYPYFLRIIKLLYLGWRDAGCILRVAPSNFLCCLFTVSWRSFRCWRARRAGERGMRSACGDIDRRAIVMRHNAAGM